MRFLFAITPVLFSSVFFAGGSLFAQSDLSSEVLLAPASTAAPQEAGLQSGRYQVKDAWSADFSSQSAESDVKIRLKPAKPATKLPAKKVQNKVVQDPSTMKTSVIVKDSALAQSLFSATTTTRPSIVLPTTSSSTTTTTMPSVTPTVLTAPAVVKEVTKAPEVLVVPDQVPEPAVFDQPAVEAYKEQIHSDDIRLNQIEISILPGVVGNDSKADYSFRDYSSFSPAVQFGAEFWMSPFLGAYGNYSTSLGADIVSNGTTNARTPAKHEWTEIGIDIRKFFGMSRRANSIEFGVNYSEYKFTVPGDEPNRVKLKTSGFGFHFSTRIPTAPTYAWILGGTIAPRLAHSEVGTGVNVQSGSTPETSRVGFDIGGEFKMARQNQMIWKLGYAFEKNQYVGPATQADPATGITPSGVSVRNSFTTFSLGYRWGQ